MSEIDRNELIRRSINDRVLRRASEDEDFRRLLIDNPKSAIARELGIDVPDGLHLTVVRESADQIYVVIPWSPEDSDGQVRSGVERLVYGTGAGYSNYMEYGGGPVKA